MYYQLAPRSSAWGLNEINEKLENPNELTAQTAQWPEGAKGHGSGQLGEHGALSSSCPSLLVVGMRCLLHAYRGVLSAMHS